MDGCTPTVYVVDDDAVVRDSLAMLVEMVGLRARTFVNAQDFLEAYDPGLAGCLVVDVRMPGMNGLELQAKLIEDGSPIPVVVVTGHGDIAMAVQAVKAGAVDFIEKPFRDQTLLDSVNKAIEIDARMRRKLGERTCVEEKLAQLTSRESQIMDMLLVGMSNKNIAYELDISPKTVDFHRSHILEKMEVQSMIELVLLAQKLPAG